jgi:mannobiose 2-epimerase
VRQRSVPDRSNRFSSLFYNLSSTENRAGVVSDRNIRNEMLVVLNDGLLKHWYPLVIDREWGGYYTNLSYDWKILPGQEKMVVTQARHVWTTSKVAAISGNPASFEEMARHGFKFLRDAMWDTRTGGFYQIRSWEGGVSAVGGWRDEKRTYGNAFAVYALAALCAQTHDQEVLDLAKRTFSWIEDHAYDRQDGGYFEFIEPDGKPFDRSSTYRTVAADANELGYKDQNSSIHLLEAYTELSVVWETPKVRTQLSGLLALIRDTMVSEEGYLRLFFSPDWVPVSFRDASEEERKANYGLDHVSFGHDYETAFLMLEASHALGLEKDRRTLSVAKKMLDHALANGWDDAVGGFFEEGYYFAQEDRCTIIKNSKNWWSQAEGLNALLLFSRIFPGVGYEEYFAKLWEYVKQYVLDVQYGDWFEAGMDTAPQFRTARKSHMWKCTYHTVRALVNCIALLSEAGELELRFRERRSELEGLIRHFSW